MVGALTTALVGLQTVLAGVDGASPTAVLGYSGSKEKAHPFRGWDESDNFLDYHSEIARLDIPHWRTHTVNSVRIHRLCMAKQVVTRTYTAAIQNQPQVQDDLDALGWTT